MIGWSHGAAAAVYVARDHEWLRPWREKLAVRGGKIAASIALYGYRPPGGGRRIRAVDPPVSK